MCLTNKFVVSNVKISDNPISSKLEMGDHEIIVAIDKLISV